MTKTSRRAWSWLEFSVVVVPLVLIVGGQYVSFSRLGQIRVLAHESQLRSYLDGVALRVERTYRDAAEAALAVSPRAVQQRRFDEIREHFAKTSHPAIKQLFVGVFEDCSCKTQFFDPKRGSLSLDADAATKAAVLRASVPWRVQQGHLLTHTGLLVDRQDPNNRIVYHILTNEQGGIMGVVGAVIDTQYFLKQDLPAIVLTQLRTLPDDVRTNSIVTVRNANGDILYATTYDAGQADAISTPIGLAFDDLQVSLRSWHTTAQQLAVASLRSQTALSMLMCVVILAGAGLTIRAERRSTRLSQLKTEFVSNVSHELRTPLASIALMGEFLRSRRLTGAKVREYGGRIEAESYRLQRSVFNILDIARIESNQRRYSFEAVDMESVMDQALRVVELPIAQKGFTLHYVRPSAPLPLVVADRGAVADAIVNVIDNAVKYSGDAREVHVRLERTADGVAIQITDHGVGIAPADHDQIFNTFHRVSNGLSDRTSGTGLGLAIVRHTVKAHGGSVLVKSAPGEGSTFEIRLPAAPNSIRHATGPERVADERLPFKSFGTPARVGEWVKS